MFLIGKSLVYIHMGEPLLLKTEFQNTKTFAKKAKLSPDLQIQLASFSGDLPNAEHTIKQS